MAETGDTVLVTGGAGFLGQHVIQCLSSDSETKEIRVLDLRPYVNQLGFKETKCIKGFVGDVKDAEKLEEVFRGVSCVIHCAAATGFTKQPSLRDAERVNTEGTRSVIHACLKFRVTRLVFTSTVDVCIPKSGDLVEVKELGCVPLTSHQLLLPALAGSKLRAEKLVLEAHGRPLQQSDETLKTAILRLTLLYGELDPYFVKESLQTAQECGGNAAYAHIQAKNKLKTDNVGGKYYFITDNTPLDCHFSFLEPFLKDRGFRLSKSWLPYYVTFLLLVFLQVVTRLLRPLLTFSLPFPPAAILHYICGVYSFNRLRADLVLDYKPPVSFSNALERSRRYYSQVSLDRSDSSSDN